MIKSNREYGCGCGGSKPPVQKPIQKPVKKP